MPHKVSNNYSGLSYHWTSVFAIVAIFAAILATGCDSKTSNKTSEDKKATDKNNFVAVELNTEAQSKTAPEGMTWIPGERFVMGTNDQSANPQERPAHVVVIDGFFMDKHEVTNAQFKAFVDATGYVTTAEKIPQVADVVAQSPPGARPPTQESLNAGAIVFRKTEGPVPTLQNADVSKWWKWMPGADWRHPDGPDSNIDELMDHPVVQVSWDDAVAYCNWAGRRLPTEAEWEFAARGGLHQQPFVWGSEPPSDTHPQANIWQGQFPHRNAATDGYLSTAPIGQFPPNGLGLYDMAGNVWEWCSDWYQDDLYQTRADVESINPQGPPRSTHPYSPEKVQRGGSFLCHRDYCSSYRPSARRSTSRDSGLAHTGFRTVMTETMWEEQKQDKSSNKSTSTKE